MEIMMTISKFTFYTWLVLFFLFGSFTGVSLIAIVVAGKEEINRIKIK